MRWHRRAAQLSKTYVPGASTSGCSPPPHRWRWPFRAAAVAEPGQQVGPPAARLDPGGLEPVRRVSQVGVAGLVSGLLVTGRVDKRGDVSAGGKDEPALAAKQLGAAVAVLPRADVVGDRGDDVGVDLDLGQVDAGPSTISAPGVTSWFCIQVDEVRVQLRGHPGGAGVPEQDVERRWLLAEQVVVHPVVPDQIAGAQPGEHFGQGPAVQVTTAGRRLRRRREPSAGQRGHAACRCLATAPQRDSRPRTGPVSRPASPAQHPRPAGRRSARPRGRPARRGAAVGCPPTRDRRTGGPVGTARPRRFRQRCGPARRPGWPAAVRSCAGGGRGPRRTARSTRPGQTGAVGRARRRRASAGPACACSWRRASYRAGYWPSSSEVTRWRSSLLAGTCMTMRTSGCSARRNWNISNAIRPANGCSIPIVAGLK